MFQKQTSLERQLQRITNDLERARKECNGFKEKGSNRKKTLQHCQKKLSEVKAELDKLANTPDLDNKKDVCNRLWKSRKDTGEPQSTYRCSPAYHSSSLPSEYLENDRNHDLQIFAFYVLVATFVCCVLFSGWIKGFM